MTTKAAKMTTKAMYTLDRWPHNGPAWHSLTDAQVVRAIKFLLGPEGLLEPGLRRWRLASAQWQADYRGLK